MARYINLDAIVAEIVGRRDRIKKGIFSIPLTGRDRADATFEYELLGNIREFLYTFELKDVDLKEELDEWMKHGPHTNSPWCTIPDAIKITAEHFFELGLKAQKGE